MKMLGGDTVFELEHQIADGSYQIGFRAHQLVLQKPTDHALEVKAIVATTEITGSESFVHVQVADMHWTALVHGVHHFKVGDRVTLYVDPKNFFLFDQQGNACALEAG